MYVCKVSNVCNVRTVCYVCNACNVMPCHVMSWHGISGQVRSRRVVTWHVTHVCYDMACYSSFRYAMSCHVVLCGSFHVVSVIIISYWGPPGYFFIIRYTIGVIESTPVYTNAPFLDKKQHWNSHVCIGARWGTDKRLGQARRAVAFGATVYKCAPVAAIGINRAIEYDISTVHDIYVRIGF